MTAGIGSDACVKPAQPLDRPPTQRELAALLRLDVSTVSRGLKNHPDVSKTTRERIQAKAAELGYRPDPALARLSRRRWGNSDAFRPANLALLTSRNDPGIARGGFVAPARRAAEALGYALEVDFLEDYQQTKVLERQLRTRGVEGILLGGLVGAEAVPSLNWNRYAVLVYGDPPFDLPFHHVRANTYMVTRTAVDYLWKAGHRRIGLVLPEIVLENDRRSLSGWENGLRSRGVVLSDAPAPFTLRFQEANRWPAVLRKWLQTERPDAAVVAGPGVPVLAAEVEKSGSTSGKPFGLVSTGAGDSDRWARVFCPTEHLATCAVEQLAAAILHGDRGIPEVSQSTLLNPVLHPAGRRVSK